MALAAAFVAGIRVLVTTTTRTLIRSSGASLVASVAKRSHSPSHNVLGDRKGVEGGSPVDADRERGRLVSIETA